MRETVKAKRNGRTPENAESVENAEKEWTANGER